MKDREMFKEYFVAIVPPAPLLDDAYNLKLYMQDKYQSKAALRSPPHITLHMPFRWKEEKEAALISEIKVFTDKAEPVKVCVDNFSAFPPRVIYMNVVNSEPLAKLRYELRKYFKIALNIFNADYKDQPFHPHLTIAFRDLKKAAFAEAWNEFKSKEYKIEFIADSLTLLKHDGKMWNVHHQFPLTSSYSTENISTLATTEG
jgi:2'-5' RNA ligase